MIFETYVLQKLTLSVRNLKEQKKNKHFAKFNNTVREMKF